MRDLPAGLAAHLGDGATTLCRCWRLTRRDGVVLGFTDHDRDLVLGGATFAAGTGWEAAEVTAELGFAVGGGEVAGALASAGITETDIAAGLYDDATVETWLVNWAAPEQRLLLATASIGEVRRADGVFVAELRGAMHRFDERRGRTYRTGCGAALGDADCRVDLSPPTFTAAGTVMAAEGARIAGTGLSAYPAGWFSGGRLVWLTGANGGLLTEVAVHRAVGGIAELALWQRPAASAQVGDTFRVSAGCDKSLPTCRTKFDNVLNHRGFPHMPGNAFIAKGARQGEPGLDGGSLFR